MEETEEEIIALLWKYFDAAQVCNDYGKPYGYDTLKLARKRLVEFTKATNRRRNLFFIPANMHLAPHFEARMREIQLIKINVHVLRGRGKVHGNWRSTEWIDRRLQPLRIRKRYRSVAKPKED